MTEKRSYKWVAQRLFCQLPIRPAEQARLVGFSRQHVANWRVGSCKPDEEARRRIHAQWASIEPALWDRADAGEPSAQTVTHTPPPAAAPNTVPSIPSDDDLPTLGIEGLERLIGELQRVRPQLPAKDAFQCAKAESAIQTQRLRLLADERDARSEYLASDDFAREVRQFARILGADAYEKFSAATKQEFGLSLPTMGESLPDDFTISELIPTLENIIALNHIHEANLVTVERIRLRLPERKTAIAKMLQANPGEESEQFMNLLDPPDDGIIKEALDRRFNVVDVCSFEPGTRAVVAALVESLAGCTRLEITNIAKEIAP